MRRARRRREGPPQDTRRPPQDTRRPPQDAGGPPPQEARVPPPQEAGDSIAERAAELATEVTEAEQPEERRRLAAAFAAAARSGARVTGRGFRAARSDRKA